MGKKKSSSRDKRQQQGNNFEDRLPLQSVENVTTENLKEQINNLFSTIANPEIIAGETLNVSSSPQTSTSTKNDENDENVHGISFKPENFFKPETNSPIFDVKSNSLYYKTVIYIHTDRNQDARDFEKKFTSFMEGLDPVFRSSLGAKIEGDDISKIIEAMKNIGLDNFWPFENPGFQTTPTDMKMIFDELSKLVKMFFMFDCYHRGYSFNLGDKKPEYSSDWIDAIDARAELDILKTISTKLKSLCEENNWTNGDLSFTRLVDNIFNVLLPALDKFDNDVLYNNGVVDRLSSIPSRKKIGFEISLEDVDEMLDTSLEMRGFGDFTVTATECVDVFTTASQLEKVLEKSVEIMQVMDVRCGYAVLKAVTHMFNVISPEECQDVLKKFGDTPKTPIQRFLGYAPEIVAKSQNKESELFKLFYSALSIQESQKGHQFEVSEMLSAMKAFYSLFDLCEVNQMILQILTRSHEFSEICKSLCQALKELPDCLVEKLEIGDKYFDGDLSENSNSMYRQIGNQFNKQGSDSFIASLINVVATSNVLSHERIFRMCFKSMDIRESKNTQNVILILFRENVISELNFTKEFVQDLILCALKMYSYPIEAEKFSRHDFIKTLFSISDKIFTSKNIALDESYLVTKWKELDHPWFVECYFAHHYKVLQFYSTKIDYPWTSQLNWDAEKVTVFDYSELVLILTAWPFLDDVDSLLTWSDSLVPQTISRVELLEQMMSRVPKLEVNESWKTRISSRFELVIHRLKEESLAKTNDVCDVIAGELNVEICQEEEAEEAEICKEEKEIVALPENCEEKQEIVALPENCKEKQEIVALPENKDDYLTHLDKEYWNKLSVAQQSIIKEYRSEIRAKK